MQHHRAFHTGCTQHACPSARRVLQPLLRAAAPRCNLQMLQARYYLSCDLWGGSEKTSTPSDGMPCRAQRRTLLVSTTARPQRFKRMQHGPRVTSRHSHSLTPSNAPAQPNAATPLPAPLLYIMPIWTHAWSMHMLKRSTSQVARRTCPLIKKMCTTRYMLMVAQALVVVSALLAVAATAATAAEYVRPPPGRIILTERTEPADHPQQVHTPSYSLLSPDAGRPVCCCAPD